MAEIRAPRERACTRCGRSERWDDEVGAWRVDADVGDVYCVHAWDVTGTFATVDDA